MRTYVKSIISGSHLEKCPPPKLDFHLGKSDIIPTNLTLSIPSLCFCYVYYSILCYRNDSYLNSITMNWWKDSIICHKQYRCCIIDRGVKTESPVNSKVQAIYKHDEILGQQLPVKIWPEKVNARKRLHKIEKW